MDTPIYHWPIYLCKGSHKRSHSLGEKEIVRSIPSPAPEQPFRDRSNTLNEKPALPIIRDKYKDLTGEVEVSHSLSLFSLVHTFSLSTQKVLLVEYSLRFLSEQSSHLVSSLSLFLPLSLIQTLVAGEWAICVRMAEVFGERSAGNIYLHTHIHKELGIHFKTVSVYRKSQKGRVMITWYQHYHKSVIWSNKNFCKPLQNLLQIIDSAVACCSAGSLLLISQS